jgi:outer membrane lipoprotein SlyB
MNTRNMTRWLMAGFLITSVLSAAVASGKVFQGTQARASSTAIEAKQTAVQPVFIQGAVEALEVYDVKPPTMLVKTTGSGEALELGKFKVTWEFTVNLDSGMGVGAAHFVAENGDKLDTKSIGQGDPPMTNLNHSRVTEIHTITGGTGRFAGATGCFSLERMVNTVTGATSGWFHGTIVYPKKN